MDNETGHIVIVAETGAIKCLHCGEQFRIDYPLTTEKLASYVEAFTWLHATCEKQDETDH
jgi:hypothetical protein